MQSSALLSVHRASLATGTSWLCRLVGTCPNVQKSLALSAGRKSQRASGRKMGRTLQCSVNSFLEQGDLNKHEENCNSFARSGFGRMQQRADGNADRAPCTHAYGCRTFANAGGDRPNRGG